MMQEEGLREEGELRTLSHSSHQTLNQCEYKYYLYKIARVARDPDLEEDTYAFRFGKALHQVMEKTYHDGANFKRAMLLDAMEEFDLDAQDFYRLYACAKVYFRAAAESGLKIILVELYISSSTSTGYIDAIGLDKNGKIWIIDLKTASRWEPLLPLRLIRDPQLSLYVAHLDNVIDALREQGYEVTKEDFAGVVYRCVTKSKIVPYLNEHPEAYTKRANPGVNFVNIRKELLDIPTVVEEHTRAWERAVELHNGAKPRRNYGKCLEWNRVCEYFSHCYGVTSTEAKELIAHATNDKPVEVSELVAPAPKKEISMLNIVIKETQWFPVEKTARVFASACLGAAADYSPCLTRPYYFQQTEEGGLNPDFMNECILEAQRRIATDFWIHLSNLRSDAIYQSWTKLLNIQHAIPANAETKAKIEKGEVVQQPVVEAPKPAPTKPAKAAKPAPVEEEVEEEAEKPAPAAKPAKAAKPKPAPVEEEAEEEVEEKPAPKAKKAAAKKGPDEVIWQVGKVEFLPYIRPILDEELPKNWDSKAKYKGAIKEVSTQLAEEKIVVLRDGEVTEEFDARVRELLADV